MEETRNVTFRLSVDLVDRLDLYAEYMQHHTPGLKVSRVDALRNLLVKGLDEAEARKSYVTLQEEKETIASTAKTKKTTSKKEKA